MAVQLRRTKDSFCLQLRRERRVGVMQLVDGAVLLILQPPGAAEINNAHTALQPAWNPLARVFVRESQKYDFDTGVVHQLPTEGTNLGLLLTRTECEMWMNLLQRHAATWSLVGDPAKEDGFG